MYISLFLRSEVLLVVTWDWQCVLVYKDAQVLQEPAALWFWHRPSLALHSLIGTVVREKVRTTSTLL